MLRQLGVDLNVQQELLRHADLRTTMNVYTQAVSEQTPFECREDGPGVNENEQK
jgi:hypothetical protein